MSLVHAAMVQLPWQTQPSRGRMGIEIGSKMTHGDICSKDVEEIWLHGCLGKRTTTATTTDTRRSNSRDRYWSPGDMHTSSGLSESLM